MSACLFPFESVQTPTVFTEVKDKVRPTTGHEGPEKEVQLFSFFNIGAR